MDDKIGICIEYCSDTWGDHIDGTFPGQAELPSHEDDVRACEMACRAAYSGSVPSASPDRVGERIAQHWIDRYPSILPRKEDLGFSPEMLAFSIDAQTAARYGAYLAFGLGLAALTAFAGWRWAIAGGVALYLGNKVLETDNRHI